MVLTEVVARSGVVMLFVGGVHAGVDADLEKEKLVLKHLLVDVILIPPFLDPPDGGGTGGSLPTTECHLPVMEHVKK